VAVVNPGGLASGLSTIQWYRDKYKPDVIFVVESKVFSHQAMRVVADRLGCSWVGMKHSTLAHGPNRSLVYGGIGAIVCNRQVRVTAVGVERRGLLAATLNVSGKQPITCLATYLPGEQSTHRPDVEPILEATKREHALATQRNGDRQVLWLGDFNTSLGNGHGHFTHDKKSSSARRCNLIRGVMQHLGLAPLHGRTAQERAEVTSLPISEMHRDRPDSGSEVDYIMGHVNWLQGRDFWLVPTPVPARAGSSVLPTSVRDGLRPLKHRVRERQAQADREVPIDLLRPPMHVPLAIDLPLLRLPAVEDANDSRPRPESKRSIPAGYLSASWEVAAEKLSPILRWAGDAARSLSWRGVAAGAGALLNDLKQRMQTTISRAAQGERRDVVPPRLRGPREYCNGRPLPPSALSAADSIRKWRREVKHVWRTCRGEELHTRLEYASAQLKASLKEKKRVVKQCVRQWAAEDAGDMQALQMWDPHSYSKKLKRECNSNPGLSEGRAFIPSSVEEGVPSAPRRFVQWCKRLFGEEREPPPALSMPARMQFVPRAPVEDLGRDVHWEEVMYVLFPPNKRSRHCCPRLGGCTECLQRLKDLDVWDPADPESPFPPWCNRIHTSKAPGPDGFRAENARWLRPREFKQRFDFRTSLCKVYADTFTDCLRRGQVPADFRRGLSLPLLKQTKDGVRPDAANPDNYRIITMSNFDAKLFGLVLLSRLQHWGSQHGVFSGTQNAFRPRRNCEQHVLTLHEVVSSRSRAGKTTWGLFVDFKKAYDSVHQEALWRVAETAGIPADLVRLLRNWNSSRTAALDINGVRTEPYPITKGVPQGDVLSPWLFNLFLESLLREIQQDGNIKGAAAFGRRFKELVYADDVVILSESLAEVGYVLDKVISWGRDWGLELGVGNKKTEIVEFKHQQRSAAGPAGPAGAAAAPAAVTVGGVTVQVVDEYKYLGYMVTRGMGTDTPPLVFKHAKNITDNFDRFFRSNSVISRMSLRAQAITCKTYVTSGTNYLACMLPAHQPVQAARMDAAAEACYKHILRLPGCGHPRGVYTAEMRATPTVGTWARERMRVYLEFLVNRDLTLPLHHVLAAQKAAADAAAAAGLDRGVRFRERTWWDDTMIMIANARAMELPVPDPRVIGRQWVKKAAAVFGRNYAYAWWQTCAVKGAEHVTRTYNWLDRPPEGTKAMVAWLNAGYQLPAPLLGNKQHSTPLSIPGPGCSGSILSNARVHKSVIDRVLAHRAGRNHAYLTGPSRAAQARESSGDAGCGAAAASQRDAAAWGRPDRCLACAAAGHDEPDDMYHHLIECPATEAQRRTLRVIGRRAVEGILSEAAKLVREVPALLKDVEHGRMVLDKGIQWHTAHGKAMLFHLALAQPWSAVLVPWRQRIDSDGDGTLATVLGEIFDKINLQPYRTWPLCTRWARAAAQLVAVCDRARELHHPVPQRRRGILLLEDEDSRRSADVPAPACQDPVGQDDDAPDPLVAAIASDLRRRLRDEPQLLDANLVSDDYDSDNDSEPAL